MMLLPDTHVRACIPGAGVFRIVAEEGDLSI